MFIAAMPSRFIPWRRHGRLRVVLCCLWLAAASGFPAAVIAATGPVVPGLAEFDRAMQEFIARWKLAGGTFAVAHHGRLVLARGYGLADREQQKPALPTTLYRVASISKVLTAVGVMHLVEDGALGIDDQALVHLLDRPGVEFNDTDPRLWSVTVRDLLQHTGGWDRDQSGDVVFGRYNRYGATPTELMNAVFSAPLDHDPGTEYAYSNFGYFLLGRIIEQLSGRRYFDFMQSRVLDPAGISAMRLGRRERRQRLPNEAVYYPAKGQHPYSLFIESYDSLGGWLASSVDLVRFLVSVDGAAEPPDQLSAETLATMLSPPRGRDGTRLQGDADTWYGMGVGVFRHGRFLGWQHNGALPGTMSLVTHTGRGTVWAAVFNGRPADADAAFNDMTRRLWDAYYTVQVWPAHDLFTHPALNEEAADE